jgi:hypothetical protein
MPWCATEEAWSTFGCDAVAASFWKQSAWKLQGAFNMDAERMDNV